MPPMVLPWYPKRNSNFKKDIFSEWSLIRITKTTEWCLVKKILPVRLMWVEVWELWDCCHAFVLQRWGVFTSGLETWRLKWANNSRRWRSYQGTVQVTNTIPLAYYQTGIMMQASLPITSYVFSKNWVSSLKRIRRKNNWVSGKTWWRGHV